MLETRLATANVQKRVQFVLVADEEDAEEDDAEEKKSSIDTRDCQSVCMEGVGIEKR
jgi:hypothetical protein